MEVKILVDLCLEINSKVHVNLKMKFFTHGEMDAFMDFPYNTYLFISKSKNLMFLHFHQQIGFKMVLSFLLVLM